MMTLPSQRSFLTALPKVELHAHINGSLPAATLQSLLRDVGEEPNEELTLSSSALLAIKEPSERMKRCFKVFDAVYRVTTTARRLRKAMTAMLQAYAAENTMLLELRTTPRAGLLLDDDDRVSEDGGTTTEAVRGTDEDYVRVVLSALDAFDAEAQKERLAAEAGAEEIMVVKLLLSVGRRMSAESAMRVVSIAATEAKRGNRVVGIDFSGDCYSGIWSTYAPAISAAKACGLKVTLHVGEKDDDDELRAMLQAGPDRIGHLVFASAANQALVRRNQLPLELCVTSNLMTTDWSVEDHHVKDWFGFQPTTTMPSTEGGVSKDEAPGLPRPGEQADDILSRCIPELVHPISINTDDRGVFDTTLVDEFELFLASAFPSQSQSQPQQQAAMKTDPPIDQRAAQAIVAVTRQGIRDSFTSAEEKCVLMNRLRTFCQQHARVLGDRTNEAAGRGHV